MITYFLHIRKDTCAVALYGLRGKEKNNSTKILTSPKWSRIIKVTQINNK